MQIENIFLNEPIVKPFADYNIQEKSLPEHDDIRKRVLREGYAIQKKAPRELVFLSQPPGPETIEAYHDYVYYSPPQREIFIYHVGLGINDRHVDFNGRKVEWIYTGRAIFTGNVDKTETLIDPTGVFNGHSTCTASKATGNIFGASKFGTLITVKMPDYTAASIAEVFWTIFDDIKSHGRQQRSLVVIPWGSRKRVNSFDPSERAYWSLIHGHLRRLTLQGTWCVFAAGDEAQERRSSVDRRRRSLMDTEPGLYLYDQGPAAIPRDLLALAVSNTDFNGTLHLTSQVAQSYSIYARNVFAPGVEIRCAAYDTERGFSIQTGMSFGQYLNPSCRFFLTILNLLAAAITVGMMANLMARSDPDEAFLQSALTGWKRPGTQHHTIWNGVDRRINPPRPPRPNVQWLNDTSNVAELARI